MQITDYFNLDGDKLTFTRQQGNDFAKKVANDFNPIHDPEHKRFCVPGDLLFAVMLQHYGLRQKMNFNFAGIVDDSKALTLPECDGDSLDIVDNKDKVCLNLTCSGDCSDNADLVASLTESYVQFSGQTFPHVLVPLMRDNNVMINPDRPLVMYQSMCICMDSFPAGEVSLALDSSSLVVNGKRGEVSLNYLINSNGNTVGHAKKSMLLSGLREYDAAKMDEVVAFYNERKIKLA